MSNPQQRIISLLPSATEIIFALGAGPHLIGVTHECDYPQEARLRSHCTANLLPPDLTAKQIDDAVSNSLLQDPHSIYRLRVSVLRDLRPSVIVTQSLCAVCAVPEQLVQKTVCTFPNSCKVVSSDPHTLSQLFGSILEIGRAIDYEDAAKKLIIVLEQRLSDVRNVVRNLTKRPSVIVLEWPDPPYAPGHWVPDMIEAAGGACVLGESGEKSRRVTWEELIATKADIIVNAFCGYNLLQNQDECDKMKGNENWDRLTAAVKVYASDASAYFSRPGNRLVDGTELLAYILHGIPQYKPSIPGCISLYEDGVWRDLSTL